MILYLITVFTIDKDTTKYVILNRKEALTVIRAIDSLTIITDIMKKQDELITSINRQNYLLRDSISIYKIDILNLDHKINNYNNTITKYRWVIIVSIALNCLLLYINIK